MGKKNVYMCSTGDSQSSRQGSSKNEQPTVFLDLRSSGPLNNSHVHSEQNGVHSLSSTAQRLLVLRGGTSERYMYKIIVNCTCTYDCTCIYM